MKIMTHTLLIISLCLISLQSFAGKFYKWTDEKGVVHYSERAPQNQKTETITTQTPPSAESQAVDSKSENTAADEKPAAVAKPAPQVVQKDPATCEKAKADLQILISRPIVRQNNKVLTIDEKNEQIQALNDIISVHC